MNISHSQHSTPVQKPFSLLKLLLSLGICLSVLAVFHPAHANESHRDVGMLLAGQGIEHDISVNPIVGTAHHRANYRAQEPQTDSSPSTSAVVFHEPLSHGGIATTLHQLSTPASSRRAGWKNSNLLYVWLSQFPFPV
ncbi:hypothetical protein [Sinobacterium norvegicum]|uniref:hypothetical protein n=1 Tax=Sinobacterium norvegicum TaxID=1641715 RepID=UPI001F18925A|nr:hypothetical protein [Sinobacterium norvegicum]